MDRRTSLTSSTRTSLVDRSPDRVRAVVAGGGVGQHWYVDALPFVARGGVDRLVGGGGRRHGPPGRPLLAQGDRVGFWHVDRSTPGELVLRAEVQSPGTVELTTRMVAVADGTSVEQTVSFTPSGLTGWAYLLADLPAREAVVELAHRRLLRDLRTPTLGR